MTTVNKATVRGRPPTFSDGNSPAINSHCSHVKLLRYALVIRSQGAVIYKSQHKPCELSYYSPPLLKHPLSLANLSGADLSKAYLMRTNLSGADLQQASLRGANLSSANLSEVNLTGADLTGANLSLADLRGANFHLCNLSGANLTDAKLIESDLAFGFC
ncbi:MAG: pentapeptide repeat-containing protein [Nostoc sp.]|uniref:pentapeptide repeat-containing protein n=1 Tax=Nostoc sp. TaxID=1180 RepID=UPI002FF488DF